MLVLEADTIRGLLANNKLTAEFPFLARMGKAGGRGAGCCGSGGTGGQSQGATVNQIKMAIAGLSEAQRTKFKELAGAEKVKVSYAAAGKIQTVRF